MRSHAKRITAMLSGIAAGSIALAACRASGAPIATRAAIGSPSPAPAPVQDPNLEPAVTVNLVAADFDFHVKAIVVPADKPFAIHLLNADPSTMLHDVDIYQLDGIVTVRDQAAIWGGTEANYVYASLARGDYLFMCSVHPTPQMTGTLRVR